MRYLITLILVLLLSSSSFSQNKKLSLRNAIIGVKDSLKIKTIEHLQWIPGSHSFVYTDSLQSDYGLIKEEADDESCGMLLSLDSLNKSILALGQKKLRRFPNLHWKNSEQVWFIANNKLYEYNLSRKKVYLRNQIHEEYEELQVEPNTMRLAFSKASNLYLSYNPDEDIQITHDTAPGISNGSSYVHRAEFGIDNGIFWSPAGNHLAYYKLDQSMVTEYPLIHVDSRPAAAEMIRYPFTGMTSEQVSIGIYHLESGSTTFLQTGEPRDQYLASVTWSPDEKFIYVVHLNRDQNHLRLVQYDPISGQPLKTILEEKNEKWVEPEHNPIFLKNKTDKFIWFSKRDGYNQLYLYSTNGKMIRKLTKEKQDVTHWIGFTENGDYGFFTASSADGLERHGYKVKIPSGYSALLTGEAGIHRIIPSPDGNYLIDRFNNIETPNKIDLLQREGKLIRNLLITPDPLCAYNLGKPELLKIMNDEGVELNARIITPPDFDPDKKYPVIVYVYGGPHGQMIRNSYLRGWQLWYHYMAQKGYIVFMLDNRGTNNRGSAFEQIIHRQLGTIEVQDQMAGIKYLKKQAFVDTTRIGVHGWSYGGFMAILMMTRQPGVFRAGVAGGPVIDWRYYEVMFGERYMDTPYSNPDGYDTANLLNYIDQLEGKLLIINGAIDPVVVWQNSLLYLRKAIDAGKQLDYFVYPGDEHNMRGQDRLHLYQKITEYFDLHL